MPNALPATTTQRKSTLNAHYVSNSTAMISTQPTITLKKAPIKAPIVLFESEKQLYGDRCPKGYTKL